MSAPARKPWWKPPPVVASAPERTLFMPRPPQMIAVRPPARVHVGWRWEATIERMIALADHPRFVRHKIKA